MVENTPLPEGWKWTTLSEVADINGRDVTIRDLPDDLPVSFVPMAAVDADQGIIAKPEQRLLKEVRKGFTQFKDGDVLFAKITPCMENGKAAIAQKLVNARGFGSTEFHVLRSKAQVTAKWLFHFVRQESFRKDAKANFSGTAGQLRVPVSFLANYPFPLPPLPEQERIVAKIEELFTQLDAGTAALRQVQAQLKRYKASVLKAACEGRLVPQDPSDEPELEARSGLDREVFDTRELPSLPKGWNWKSASEFCSAVECGSTPKADLMTGGYGEVPFIKVYNLTFDGTLDFSIKPTFVSIETQKTQLKRSRVMPGDVLTNIVGPPLGKVSIVPDTFPEWNINQAIVLFRPGEGVINKYLSYVLQSPGFQKRLKATSRATAGQFNVSLSTCRKIPIPIPPLTEQKRIVAELEQSLSIAQKIETTIEKGLDQANRLRQSILKRAFEGKLIEPGPEMAQVQAVADQAASLKQARLF